MNAHTDLHAGPKAEHKSIQRMVGLVLQTEEWYQKHRADEVIRNLSYYRGRFWDGDGISIKAADSRGYNAVQNEIFPIVDTIVSALAMDLPQVEALDQRQGATDVPEKENDPTFAGRRIASVLNWFAEEDELDTVIQELVLHALLFDQSVVKVSWSSNLGRPIWRTKLPWEVHFDPSAKRVADVGWSFERFVLHYDDFRGRIESGVYDRPKKAIPADTYPSSIIDTRMPLEQEVELREKGLKEYVSLIEFWDFRKKKLYHLHPDTAQLLMEADMPYERPYDALIFHPGVGRIRGISDVSLIAPIQRDINELVSARREIVARLPRRMLVDRKLFRSDEEFERWKNARSWEPVLVEGPPDGTIDQHVWVSPEMPTTFDFNTHLNQGIESIRWLPGMADYQHGQVKNIRTAAEANMIRGAIEGRLNIRARKVVRVVTSMFRKALATTKWALRNPEASGINVEAIASITQAEPNSLMLQKDLLEVSPSFRLLPFSPLMEDKIARRDSLTNLLAPLSSPSPLGEAMNQRELAKEIVDAFGFRPSLVKTEEEAVQEQAAAQQEELSPGAAGPGQVGLPLPPNIGLPPGVIPEG